MEKISINIGNTPIKRLREIEKMYNLKNELYIKAEHLNPTGSIKDRPALNMLLKYQEEGYIKDDTHIIEATSGNMGISLAALCLEFNIPCTIVMPFSASKERRDIIKSYKANIILVEGGMEECNEKVKQLIKENNNYLWFDQFNNINNLKAHYNNTAREIESQLNNIDYIFIGFGSSGTISGISAYYKDKGYQTKFIGIEPKESPLLTKGYAASHLIQGIGANFIPPIMRRDNIQEIITVKGLDAINVAKILKEKEGLDVGISSGANVLGMISYSLSHKLENKRLLTLSMDKGDRYSW